MNFSKRQKQTLKLWFTIILLAEVIFTIPWKFSIYLYVIGGALFLIGFILRLIDKYPGKAEPLILDVSSGLLCFCIFIVSKITFNPIIIYTGPIIVLLPHIIYILLYLQ